MTPDDPSEYYDWVMRALPLDLPPGEYKLTIHQDTVVVEPYPKTVALLPPRPRVLKRFYLIVKSEVQEFLWKHG